MKIFTKKLGSLNQFKKRIKLGGIITPYKGGYTYTYKFIPMKNKITLPLDTKLKLIAIHKETFDETYTTITYQDWINFKKNRNYYYRAIQII